MQRHILYIYGLVCKRKYYYPYSHANLCLEIILYKTFAFGRGEWGSLSKYRKYCYHYLVNSFLYTTLYHQQILSGPDV